MTTAILHFFTPEIALCTFILLALFFASITFPARKAVRMLVSLYVWRAGLLIVADVAAAVYDSFPMRAFSVRPETVMAACDVLLFAGLYALLQKYIPIGRRIFPWFVSFAIYCSLAGFFISTLAVAFPEQIAFALPRFGLRVFGNPIANGIWYFAPLAVVAAAERFGKRNLRNIRVESKPRG
ncbi:MAG: hypothetical protein COV41_00775 [Candidatus Brennerbacteria bacterium CG11_big_fil_rev_8_21_14_0_20_43_10]|uniref:Uncharacterized protein n=1 Tax=Candidatus Brennerbacteria bacterium CG11_big_fil_rev_8_21_14_0_20_43_10 TaxID=1974523 RepID=A0A2H0PXL2_9BACT|nr:MAG: hypothetical protein COV41_00775 [Candidatus Brennerbacteria bacterium CG11_big_fil_rev_8_21_14_0_20_43_10]